MWLLLALLLAAPATAQVQPDVETLSMSVTVVPPVQAANIENRCAVLAGDGLSTTEPLICEDLNFSTDPWEGTDGWVTAPAKNFSTRPTPPQYRAINPVAGQEEYFLQGNLAFQSVPAISAGLPASAGTVLAYRNETKGGPAADLMWGNDFEFANKTLCLRFYTKLPKYEGTPQGLAATFPGTKTFGRFGGSYGLCYNSGPNFFTNGTDGTTGCFEPPCDLDDGLCIVHARGISALWPLSSSPSTECGTGGQCVGGLVKWGPRFTPIDSRPVPPYAPDWSDTLGYAQQNTGLHTAAFKQNTTALCGANCSGFTTLQPGSTRITASDMGEWVRSEFCFDHNLNADNKTRFRIHMARIDKSKQMTIVVNGDLASPTARTWSDGTYLWYADSVNWWPGARYYLSRFMVATDSGANRSSFWIGPACEMEGQNGVPGCS